MKMVAETDNYFMSADNRICVMRNESGDFSVWEGSLSIDYFQPPAPDVSQFVSEEEAVAFAVSLAKECMVLEGGIQTITKEEQLRGLAYEIEDLSSRMRHLVEGNSQWEYNFN